MHPCTDSNWIAEDKLPLREAGNRTADGRLTIHSVSNFLTDINSNQLNGEEIFDWFRIGIRMNKLKLMYPMMTYVTIRSRWLTGELGNLEVSTLKHMKS